jgi:hypothetical protein
MSLPIPLAAPIGFGNAVVLAQGEGETENCPGKASVPKAAPGFLCVYTKLSNLMLTNVVLETTVAGFVGLATFDEGSEAAAWGSYAMTAP